MKRLIDSCQSLPGIGPRSAQRIVFYLLGQSSRVKALDLAESLERAARQVGHCSDCRIYTENTVCDICANPKRDSRLLCVVENPADAMAIEQTAVYKGLYFVLQGHLSPLDSLGPKEIGIPALFERLNQGQVTELILATNPTTEGKATAYYIVNYLPCDRIRCSQIAFGVPLGGELEYLDGGTLQHAFHARTTIVRDAVDVQ